MIGTKRATACVVSGHRIGYILSANSHVPRVTTLKDSVEFPWVLLSFCRTTKVPRHASEFRE
jgi:hypothetical protein